MKQTMSGPEAGRRGVVDYKASPLSDACESVEKQRNGHDQVVTNQHHAHGQGEAWLILIPVSHLEHLDHLGQIWTGCQATDHSHIAMPRYTHAHAHSPVQKLVLTNPFLHAKRRGHGHIPLQQTRIL